MFYKIVYNMHNSGLVILIKNAGFVIPSRSISIEYRILNYSIEIYFL